MKNTAKLMSIMLIVFGFVFFVGCSSGEQFDDDDGIVECLAVVENGLEMSVFDSDTGEVVSDATIYYFYSDDQLELLVYDEWNEDYIGVYSQGTYTIYVTCDGYETQEIEMTFEYDGPVCPQLELQQIDVNLEAEEEEVDPYRACLEEKDNLNRYGILEVIVAVKSEANLETFMNDYGIVDEKIYEYDRFQVNLVKHSTGEGTQAATVCTYEEDERVEWADLAFQQDIHTNYYYQVSCEAAGGSWWSFPDSCVDACEVQASEIAYCLTAFTWGCDCGDGCWDFETESCMSPEEYEG